MRLPVVKCTWIKTSLHFKKSRLDLDTQNIYEPNAVCWPIRPTKCPLSQWLLAVVQGTVHVLVLWNFNTWETTYLQPKSPNFMVLGLNYGLIYGRSKLAINLPWILIQVVPQFVFVILTAYTHPNSKSWVSFEKIRKFATWQTQEFWKSIQKWLR